MNYHWYQYQVPYWYTGTSWKSLCTSDSFQRMRIRLLLISMLLRIFLDAFHLLGLFKVTLICATKYLLKYQVLVLLRYQVLLYYY